MPKQNAGQSPSASGARRRSAEAALNDARLLQLVESFIGGEESAFDALAPMAGRMAYHLALRSVADTNVAEEIAQEALMRLYRRVHEIKGVGAFKTWYYRIVLNLVHDHYRRNTRRDTALNTLEEVRTVEVKSREEPLTALERSELRAALTDALNTLDEKHREVFLLKEVEGLPHGEIAQMLGVPEGTVWSRLSYARKKLLETLKRRDFIA